MVFLIVACSKDDECIDSSELTDMSGELLYLARYPTYDKPCFNPNNPDEIIFSYTTYETELSSKILKYNLSSKEYETIYEGFLQSRPRWGRNDWILLPLFNESENNGFNIWKIRSNGDSLTQLTYSGNCHTPDWNIVGDKFIYKLGFTSPTKYIMADEFGNFIDTTLIGTGGGGTWQHDSLIANGNFKGLFLGNPYSKFYDYQTLFEPNEISSISRGGAEWLNQETVIWAHVTGMYKTNIITNETELLKETCISSYYQLPTYSPQSSKVVFVKVDRVNRGSEGGDLYSKLYIMNTDGSNEQKIEIPE